MRRVAPWPPASTRPQGRAAQAFARAHDYGLALGEYLARANESIAIIAQIEHIDAVANLDEILAVPGIDCLFVGPLDLSGSMGLLGQMTHPEVQEVIGTVVMRAKAAGMPLGLFVGDGNAAHDAIGRGFDLIAMSTDGIYLWTAARGGIGGGAQMSVATLVLEDGSIYTGAALGASRRRRLRAGLQHRHDRLSGSPHRSVVSRPGGVVHGSPHRQRGRQPRRLRIVAPPGRGRGDPPAQPGRQQLARRAGPGRLAGDARRARHQRRGHARPDDQAAQPGHTARRALYAWNSRFRVAGDGAGLARSRWSRHGARGDVRRILSLDGRRRRRVAEGHRLASSAASAPHIVAYDFGSKRNILRHLAARGARVTVVPATTTWQEALALQPDGVVLSNGPGDPAGLPYAVEATRGLLASGLPVLGICLGHQLMGLALGGRTTRLKFGHHGVNHPVQDVRTGQVYITSQNHNYCVETDSLDPAVVALTHISLNDGSLEGLRLLDRPALSVQYHPEASAGPHDAEPIFDEFFELLSA